MPSGESQETDNSSKQDLDILDLWSFIKNSKATESASFKVLRKFILSLNKKELKHLIETYLKSKLSKRKHDKTVSYTQSTTKRLLNANNSDTKLNAIDKQILSKLNLKYGKKYNKKVVKKIQQHCKNKQNKRLLSIHPQVLAYSFQYLSYKQLCKIQHTCTYFTYLNKQYPALTHYYLEFDNKLFLNVVKNKINLNFLANYKHLHLNYLYHDSDQNGENTKKTHSKLFQYILKTIISQSISNLRTLQITPRVWRISDYAVRRTAAFNLLLFIMNEFHQLPLTNLIWDSDIFKPSQTFGINVQQIMVQIQAKIVTHFPQLKHFEFGILNLDTPHDPQLSTLSNSIIIPVISNYDKLESLTLNCPLWNVLHSQHALIPLIAAKMENLKTFSVTCLATETCADIAIDSSAHCISVQELSVTLERSTRAANTLPNLDCATYAQRILSRLFSCFIGIQMFTFDCAYSFVKVAIDWQPAFKHLLRNKRIYGTNNAPISTLQSLTFKRTSYENSINILKSLTNLKQEIYFELNKFDIQTRCTWSRPNSIPTLFAQFVDVHFIPFIKNVEDDFELSAINISFYECYFIYEGYFEPVLKLLDNMPTSLTSFKLLMPYQYSAKSRGQLKIQETECTKLAKKLSLILAGKTGEAKLETIALGNLELSTKSKNFLLFYFGFNNKLIVENGKYYFKFV